MTAHTIWPLESPFFIGCNYWASHAGTAMWSDWRPDVVERDLKLLSEAGLEVLRVFPLWPDFQPIRQMYGAEGGRNGYRFGEEHMPDTEAGQAGMSQLMMDRFIELVSIAERCGLKLIVGLITGWMSGRLFVPPALEGRNILTDPDSIRWQVRFVTHFIRETKTLRPIIAWDLGNECNVMAKVESREQAWLWTSSLAHAIKAADAGRPLISGMHSLSPNGHWTMQDQGELTDLLTTHPYPFWTPYADYDPIDTFRPIIHATAESLYYGQIGGKPCFAEEMGTMGPMVCSEEVAASFARASILSQWSHGLPGMLWWCAYDQTLLQHAPYDWVACEGELGLVSEIGRVKPVLREMARIREMIAGLPCGQLPPRLVDGVCILGTDSDHWSTAFGTFMLCKQAGLDIEFQYEDQPIRDAGFYLLPCLSGVKGIPKRRWEQLIGKVKQGATLYISMDAGYMLNFSEVTGLRVVNRMRRSGPAEVKLLTNIDTDADADSDADAATFSIPGTFKYGLESLDAEPLAVEDDGSLVFSRAVCGKGTVYFCSVPLEQAMVEQAETSFRPDRFPYWRMYRILAERITPITGKVAQVHNDPLVGITEHPLDEFSRVAVLINYSPEPRTVSLKLCEGWSADTVYYGAPGSPDGSWSIAANDAVIVRLSRQP